MKTLCFSLGLLLLVVCCCNAMPQAVKYSTSPVSCCFSFSNFKIPKHRVSNITPTHISCLKKGFILETVLGRRICYKKDFKWAANIYNLYNIEGSSSY